MRDCKIAAARAGVPLKEWVDRTLTAALAQGRAVGPSLKLREPGGTETAHDLTYEPVEGE